MKKIIIQRELSSWWNGSLTITIISPTYNVSIRFECTGIIPSSRYIYNVGEIRWDISLSKLVSTPACDGSIGFEGTCMRPAIRHLRNITQSTRWCAIRTSYSSIRMKKTNIIAHTTTCLCNIMKYLV